MNKKITRIISILLVLIMSFSVFTSCNKTGDQGNINGENSGGNAGDGVVDDGGSEEQPPHVPMADPIDDNYRTFYQIFVGSFSDSNGDGIGDLQGIINRMDYLNDGDITAGDDLGVQGIWLSPIFASPTYHKYDAKSYYKIDPQFGDEAKLKELIDLCHERNVKIIMDLAINHTSSDNQWFSQFKQARKDGDTENKYYDYYSCVTSEERKNGVQYQQIPGTNYWYECNFSGEMPELNFDNPDVKEEILNVAKYYIDLGIDGFRFDAVKYIYFGDTERSVEFWEWYMSELTAYSPDIYCVGECWSAENEVLEYYSALNCFNFTTSGAESVIVRTAKGADVAVFTKYIETYQDKVQAANPNGMPMTFLSNHDMDRIAGTFIFPEQMKMTAQLYLLSPGSPVIYYGEEIGIKGSRGKAMTDANRRLAMLWGDGDTVKNPTGSTYASKYQITTTVQSQLEDETSMLSTYQEILAVRHKYPAIARGDYNAVTANSYYFGGFYIEYEGEILGLFHNTSDKPISLDLSKCGGIDGHTFTTVSEVIGDSATLDGNMLTIGAYTSIILQ